jgi:hypothetical protein
MKARLVPLYFKSGMDEDFKKQLSGLKSLLAEEAELLEPVALGSRLPDADAVVFPQLLGEAFKRIDELRKVRIPFVILTSEFGTVNMWDWEIVSFMITEGLEVLTPYSLELTRKVCRTLALKRALRSTRFLMYQDNPGEGMQAEIFKRFYWWEERCTKLIKERFGVSILKKSFKEMGAQAKQIPDAQAEEAWKGWDLKTDLSPRALNSAIKIYLTVRKEVEKDPAIGGVGINCLNESFYSDTTPCLAWAMLFEERGLLWACEADTMSLLSKYIIHKCLDAPIMMSNIYPFLMGQAALKHEHIEDFPKVAGDPEDYLLMVHCGYLGVVPPSFSTEWTLRPKVLDIVDENASAIDARMPEGPVTISKLDPTLSRLQIIEGELEKYAQYPGSHCRNGAVIRVADGHRLMEAFYSHHNLLITGHRAVELKFMAQALGLEVDQIA